MRNVRLIAYLEAAYDDPSNCKREVARGRNSVAARPCHTGSEVEVACNGSCALTPSWDDHVSLIVVLYSFSCIATSCQLLFLAMIWASSTLGLLRTGTTSNAKTRIISSSKWPGMKSIHTFLVYAPDCTDSEALSRRLAVRESHLSKAKEDKQGGFVRKLKLL